MNLVVNFAKRDVLPLDRWDSRLIIRKKVLWEGSVMDSPLRRSTPDARRPTACFSPLIALVVLLSSLV
jgi:hypothetical protein